MPSKLVPSVVKSIVTYYKDNRQNENELFNQFLNRVGLEEVTTIAAKAQETGENTQPGSDMYVDWERTDLYVLERGEGECAV